MKITDKQILQLFQVLHDVRDLKWSIGGLSREERKELEKVIISQQDTNLKEVLDNK